MAHANLTGTLLDGRMGQERIWFIDWAQGQMLREGKDTYLQTCNRSLAAGSTTEAARQSHVIWITLNDSPLYSVLRLSASFSPIHQPLLKSASLQTYSSTYTFTCKAWRQKRGNVAERWFVLESHPAHSFFMLQKTDSSLIAFLPLVNYVNTPSLTDVWRRWKNVTTAAEQHWCDSFVIQNHKIMRHSWCLVALFFLPKLISECVKRIKSVPAKQGLDISVYVCHRIQGAIWDQCSLCFFPHESVWQDCKHQMLAIRR